ncbi:hypothetical protein HN51_040884, partial [Arachis hypogaea]
MLTRLAIYDDSKLEPLLSKLLPLCIPSLFLNSAAVCNKDFKFVVASDLGHIGVRLKREDSFSIEFMDLQSEEVILTNCTVL